MEETSTNPNINTEIAKPIKEKKIKPFSENEALKRAQKKDTMRKIKRNG